MRMPQSLGARTWMRARGDEARRLAELLHEASLR
eukprot:CAMPEP_0174887988 /NCGR_PEP_ID=MMETSP0167-20121228/3244_1 /TAXON_ID=38298 /ORGANISM="Rhodella maculata, Strain CCMP736" /LENGTH=33 /DNA_ID= /DNA_START= /DNA_END= /DNA_ORIENTATION=